MRRQTFKFLQVLALPFLLCILGCAAQSTEEPGGQLKATSTPVVPVALTESVSAPSPRNPLGVHLLLSDGRYDWPVESWRSHLAYARQAVGEWGYVLELVRLDDLDVARWQQFMDLCAELHLTPVLRLATTFDPAIGWSAPPADADGTYHSVAAEYARFVVALRWPAEAHYVTVGNEPNHGPEWGGRPEPAAYARFLIDVADALHQADPQTRVLNAGFDPYAPHTGDRPFVDGQYYMDEETFLDKMVAAYPDVFTRLDLWASHAYPHGPFSAGPWQQSFQIDLLNGATNPQHAEPPPSIVNRGVNGYEWELFKLSTYGLPSLSVMITETGWRHAESTDSSSPDDDRPLPDAETVAAYMDLALRGNDGRYPHLPEAGWTPWLTDPRVVAVVFFAFDGHPSLWGHTNWLLFDTKGQVSGTHAPFDLAASLSGTR
jgi:hypothetical protein